MWRDVEVRATFFENLGRKQAFWFCRTRRVVEASRRSNMGCLHVAPRRLGVIWSSDQAHTVDALAVRGDEGRGSLRKVPGSWQQASIRECPNGETHRASGIPA